MPLTECLVMYSPYRTQSTIIPCTTVSIKACVVDIETDPQVMSRLFFLLRLHAVYSSQVMLKTS